MNSKINSSEQFYSTYRFGKERDVALLEFDEAQKIASGQTRLYGQVTNALLAVATLTVTFFLNKDWDTTKALGVIGRHKIGFAVFAFFIGFVLLRYFVDLQRQITVNARKVISLRRMLGLNYESFQLTISKDEVEGASDPFVVKFFTGWIMFRSLPFWIVTATANLILYWTLDGTTTTLFIPYSSLCVDLRIPFHIALSIAYVITFRRPLFDLHETFWLNFTFRISKLFRFTILNDWASVIYRAKLSVLELRRLSINYTSLKEILVEVEDKRFYRHSGVDVKSILRAFLSRFKKTKDKFRLLPSGGSTIPMQLARTLLIPTTHRNYTRKVFEIMLSLWLSKQFKKEDILDLYIASVRYDRGVMGLSNAVKHFFGQLKGKVLTSEESFILVERLSNITQTANRQRIRSLLHRIPIDVDQTIVMKTYDRLACEGKLAITEL